ncbi:MAG: hypothetical protein Ta2E_06340 [Mycoplasmoidaceae bacterium]|nr:MAG: hypothetical protein Ta2E_06340 [Mycoplasmoidaceae bacterium]
MKKNVKKSKILTKQHVEKSSSIPVCNENTYGATKTIIISRDDARYDKVKKFNAFKYWFCNVPPIKEIKKDTRLSTIKFLAENKYGIDECCKDITYINGKILPIEYGEKWLKEFKRWAGWKFRSYEKIEEMKEDIEMKKYKNSGEYKMIQKQLDYLDACKKQSDHDRQQQAELDKAKSNDGLKDAMFLDWISKGGWNK